MKRLIMVSLIVMCLAGCGKKAKVYNGGEWYIGEKYTVIAEITLIEVSKNAFGDIILRGDIKGYRYGVNFPANNIKIFNNKKEK